MDKIIALISILNTSNFLLARAYVRLSLSETHRLEWEHMGASDQSIIHWLHELGTIHRHVYTDHHFPDPNQRTRDKVHLSKTEHTDAIFDLMYRAADVTEFKALASYREDEAYGTF